MQGRPDARRESADAEDPRSPTTEARLRASERRIALAIGLSRSTISDYLKRAGNAGIAWPIAAEIDDAALERRLFPSIDLAAEAARPLPDWNCVHKELKRRGVTLQLLWEEYRAEHGDGYC